MELETEQPTGRDNSIRGRLLRFRRKHAKLFGARNAVVAAPPITTQSSNVDSSMAPFSMSFLEQTWDDWLDVYASGTDANISDIAKPECFAHLGYVAPPAAKHLWSYDASNHDLINKAMYEQREWLLSRVQPLLTAHQVGMCTFSTLDSDAQHVHFEVGLRTDSREISREMSIDGHTILSKDYFCLLDAKQDWRTKLNPLVQGQPYYRFYFGVPVLIRGVYAGVLALFDAYPRSHLPLNFVERVSFIASQLGERLSHELDCMENAEGTPNTPQQLDDWNMDGEVDEKPRRSEEKTETLPAVQLSRSWKVSRASSLTRKLSARETTVLPSRLFESLTRPSSLNQSMRKACRIVSRILGVSTVYIVEVRVNHATNNHATNNHATKNHATKMKLVAQRSAEGNRTQDVSQLLEHFCAYSNVHGQALGSDYGVRLHVLSNSLRDGVLIPFRRRTKNKSGYLLGAFSPTDRQFSTGDVAFLQKMAKVLDQVIEHESQK